MNLSPREAYEDWMEASRDDPASTRENKKYSVKPHLEWLESRGIQDYREITTNDVVQYLKHQNSGDLAKSTISTRWYYIRSWAEWVTSQAEVHVDARKHSDKHDYYSQLEPAREYDYGDNPYSPVDLDEHVKEDRDSDLREDQIIYFSEETYQHLLNEAKTPREDLLLRILWDTGIRASEVTTIDLQYIDLDTNSLEVISAKKPENVDRDDKTRTVYYTQPTKTAIRDWIRSERGKYTGSESSSKLLLTEKSEEFSSEMVRKTVYAVVDRCDSVEAVKTDDNGDPILDAQGHQRRKIYPHAFRHSFAVHRVKSGMPLPYLKELMGHSSVEVTEDRYLKFRKDDVREAYERYQP
jgi:integrase/recombinase XerD